MGDSTPSYPIGSRWFDNLNGGHICFHGGLHENGYYNHDMITEDCRISAKRMATHLGLFHLSMVSFSGTS